MRSFPFRTLIIVISIGLLTIPIFSFAQNKIKVSGTVLDNNKKPLSFVTVRLFKQKDPINPFLTTLSKENGLFVFNKVDTGNYNMTFTHTGFAEKKQRITVKSGDMEIGNIELARATGTLKEVVVKTQRPLVEQADDKIIFNAEDDPAAKTETAIELLRKTPFISVDGDENIQVNGKSNFKVLLNGRETSMFARNIKEALRGFPGSLISKIEVITSPSAKYDGEGIGGLINIITKKKVVGYNGSVSVFGRTLDKFKAVSANANAKIGKFGAAIFMNTGGQDPVEQQTTVRTIPTKQSVFSDRTMGGTRSNSYRREFGNAELSWEIDSLNTLSTYANINSYSGRGILDQTIITQFNSGSSLSYFDLDVKNDNPGYSVGTDYFRKFKKNKEKEFSIRYFGEFGKNNSFQKSTQENPGTDRFIINNSKSINNQYTFQTDYITPVQKTNKLETGLKAILRRASSDFESLIKYDPSASYKINTANTDYFKYLQNVFSLYGLYNFKIKKSTIRLGARVEHTEVDGDFISSNTKVNQSYTTFLPNIHFSNRLSKTLTLVANYSKRLQRPYISDLNPFVFNNDSLNISFGNPDLEPQIIHTLSTQFRLVKGTSFASANLEANYSDNKILNYSTFEPQTGITKNTSLNIGKEFQLGLNLNINLRPTTKWTFFTNTMLRYGILSENTLGPIEGFGYFFNINNTYSVSKKFSLSSFFSIGKQRRIFQTIFPVNSWYNIAADHKFLKEKLNVSLRAVNFLQKKFKNQTVTEDVNFISRNTEIRPYRGIAVAVTWNFGKLKESVSKKKGVINDDLLNRSDTQSN